jgi:hypothetical protein
VELADELRLMADWLELDEVVVFPIGDLGPALAEEMARSRIGYQLSGNTTSVASVSHVD